QRRREQGRQQVQERHGDEGRDDRARQIDQPPMLTEKAPGLNGRNMAHRRKLEIFAPQQIAVEDEKRHKADAGEDRQQEDDEIDENRKDGEAKPHRERRRDRQGPAERTAGVDRAFDDRRDLIEKEAGDQRGGRRREKDQAGDEAERDDDRQDRAHPSR